MNNDSVKLPASGSVWRKGDEWRIVYGRSDDLSRDSWIYLASSATGNQTDRGEEWCAWVEGAECLHPGLELAGRAAKQIQLGEIVLLDGDARSAAERTIGDDPDVWDCGPLNEPDCLGDDVERGAQSYRGISVKLGRWVRGWR